MTEASIAAKILPMETYAYPIRRAAPLDGTSMNLLPACAPLLASVVAGRSLYTSCSVVVRSNASRFPQYAQLHTGRAAT
ncbi:TPA: hypothetical protein SAY52_005773 [Burkholderia cenocepacia]|uniref:hypothetical protein n=1 Tax=Burkholderia sp. BCC0801 TaxID=2676291 RepID=UPI00158ADB1A|nr:hypothetical protein [Burkholderia sp. BCC0801]HEF5875083.1 hypothetical protein [Burkholderia cenocepacia]